MWIVPPAIPSTEGCRPEPAVSKSAALTAPDVRAVYELAAEGRDLGADPAPRCRAPQQGPAGRGARGTARGGGGGPWGAAPPGGGGPASAGGGRAARLWSGRAETRGIGEWGWDNGFDQEPWVRSVETFDA